MLQVPTLLTCNGEPAGPAVGCACTCTDAVADPAARAWRALCVALAATGTVDQPVTTTTATTTTAAVTRQRFGCR